MLHKLTLKNFRQHKDLTIHFTAGMNVFRAPNESGKSTVLEALCYALFGARGLKEDFEAIIPWDDPKAKPSVELTLEVAGVSYRLTRSKAGAEAYVNDKAEPLVTGQSEVTKFCERLLGAAQDMASKLMLAKQKALGGALSEGATGAGRMIEDLSDLSLIDDLLELAAKHLPVGNTSTTEALIASLRAQGEAELVDTDTLEACYQGKLQLHSAADQQLAAARSQLDELDIDQAHQILAQAEQLKKAIAADEAALPGLQAKVDAALPAPVEQAVIDAAYAEVEAEKSYEAAARLHQRLVAADISVLWDQPLEALNREIADVATNIATLEDKLETARTARQQAALAFTKAQGERRAEWARVEARIIKDETCAFCGKDLKDVPEVALVNNPLHEQLLEIERAGVAAEETEKAAVLLYQGEVKSLQDALDKAIAYRVDLDNVLKVNDAAERLYAAVGTYIELDRSTVPAQWKWIGPEISDARPNLQAELDQLLARRQAYDKAVMASAAADTRLAEVTAHLAHARAELAALPLADAQDTLDQAAQLKSVVASMQAAISTARLQLDQAAAALRQAQATNTARQEAAARAKANLAQAERQLAEQQENNELVKKLRAARPQITDKLWGIVLAAVTTYLSEVRGERSVITRADGRFLINGKPVTSLSGGAEDVLGLSIRLALTRMFLPNVDFLVLDEVAAACDDARETAMLGLVATCGFPQVLLVTHSHLADAFSDNIITL